jgi:Rieske Fe-S protein
MKRRDFIKEACGYCAMAAGLGVVLNSLSSCASMPVYKAIDEQGALMIPVSSFTTANTLVVRNARLEYDILLVKKNEQEFHALYMMCTHQDNPLTATNTGLFCASHGSSFDLEGRVTKAPANKPLRTFPVQRINDFIRINIQS